MLLDLARTPLARTLVELSSGQRSGDLQVSSGSAIKTVFFDRGRLVFAASNLKQDRLGESLVDVGRISESEFEAAVEIMRIRRQRFGDALVQAGVMSSSELGRSVARQVKRIVLSLFAFRDGVAQFEPRECPIPTEYMVNLSLHRVLYEGIGRMTTEALVERGLGDLSRKVALAEVAPFRFSIDRCTDEERDVLERCRARATSLVRVIDGAGGMTLPVTRAAYALLASGVLRVVEGGEQTQPVLQADEEGFLLSPLQRRSDDPDRASRRRQIVADLARSGEDPGGWLPGRTAAEVRRFMDHHVEMLKEMDDDGALRSDVELLLGRAYVVLHRMEHGSGETGEVLPEETGAVPEEEIALDLAPSPESPASPASPAPPARAHASVEDLLTWGNIQLTISDYGTAVRTFAQLVDREPAVASYRLRLATAMALHPPTAKQAERVFHDALRLEPNNADARYQLAIYYKSMKLRARALEQLRLVLSITPGHKRAREDLEALSPQDNALTTLKKLFR